MPIQIPIPHMNVGRYQVYEAIVAGMKQTGIPFVQHNGSNFVPTAFSDDVGMYYIIPKLVLTFGISLEHAITYFNGTISSLAAILGIFGFCYVYQSTTTRLLGIAGVIFATKTSLMTNDVYRTPAALTIALIPWAIYFLYHEKGSAWVRSFFLMWAGLGIGLGHFIRAFSTIPIFLIIAMFILKTKSFTVKEKWYAACFAALGFLAPAIFFTYCSSQYQAFARKEFPTYAWIQLGHPFWHSVYAGLGFIENNFGFKFDDSVSFNKATSIDPTCSQAHSGETAPPPYHRWGNRYEQILRNEVLKMAIRYPHYMLENYCAKLGVICVYLLRYINVGLLAWWAVGLPSNIILAFVPALAWASLPGIIGIPIAPYLLSLIALCILFAVVSINHFLLSNGFVLGRNRFSQLKDQILSFVIE